MRTTVPTTRARRGSSQPLALVLFAACIAAAILTFAPRVAAKGAAEIRFDRSQRFQTIDGWQAVAEMGQLDDPDWRTYQDEIIRRAANELGIDRIGINVRCGMERRDHVYLDYRAGKTQFKAWKVVADAPVNDNDDPFVADLTGFQFEVVDDQMDAVVVPLRKAIEARGETLTLVATFVDFHEAPFEHRDAPEEYAELIDVVFRHLRSKYGFAPDVLEVILEPDVGGWNGEQVGRALVAARKRLAQSGFSPRFSAPATTSMAAASRVFDQMATVDGAVEALTELSYHRYRDVSPEALNAITERARRYGLSTAMLERVGAGHETLHQDLAVGGNVAWEQFALAYPAQDDEGSKHFYVTKEADGTRRVHLGARSRFLRQYFLYVRKGAVRTACTSDDGRVAPLGFVAPDGRDVVVVKAARAASFTIAGLAAGRYGLEYTTADAGPVRLDDVELGQGGVVRGAIPAQGVLTVFGLRPR